MMEMAHQADHRGHHDNEKIDSDEDNAQPPFKLTISEYEEVAARHEASLKLLDLVKSAIDTPENIRAMSERIERECE